MTRPAIALALLLLARLVSAQDPGLGAAWTPGGVVQSQAIPPNVAVDPTSTGFTLYARDESTPTSWQTYLSNDGGLTVLRGQRIATGQTLPLAASTARLATGTRLFSGRLTSSGQPIIRQTSAGSWSTPAISSGPYQSAGSLVASGSTTVGIATTAGVASPTIYSWKFSDPGQDPGNYCSGTMMTSDQGIGTSTNALAGLVAGSASIASGGGATASTVVIWTDADPSTTFASLDVTLTALSQTSGTPIFDVAEWTAGGVPSLATMQADPLGTICGLGVGSTDILFENPVLQQTYNAPTISAPAPTLIFLVMLNSGAGVTSATITPVAFNISGGGPGTSSLIRSTNDGVTFTPVQAIDPTDLPTDASLTGTLQGVATFPTIAPAEWLALDASAQVWRSLDSAATWSLVTQLSAATPLLTSLLCPAGTSICLAGTNDVGGTSLGLYRSTDRGQTWSQTLSAPVDLHLSALVDLGQGVIVALGDPTTTAAQPLGFRSTDSGSTWQPIPSPRLVLPSGGFFAYALPAPFQFGPTVAALLAQSSDGAGAGGSQVLRSAVGVNASIPVILPRQIQGVTAPGALGGNGRVVTPLPPVTVSSAVTLLDGAIPTGSNLARWCTNGATPIRIGDASITTTKGSRVGPNQIFRTTGTYAWYAVSEGGSSAQPVRIQTTGRLGGNAQYGDSLDLPLPVTPIVGHRLILRTWGFESGVSFPPAAWTVTDNQTPPNTYTVNVIPALPSGIIASAVVVTATAPFVVTVSTAGGMAQVEGGLDEWDGLGTIDVVASAFQSGGPGASPDTGATATTAHANSTAFAVFGGQWSDVVTVTPNAAGSNPATGWVQTEVETDGAANSVGAGVYAPLSLTGAIRHAWTVVPGDNQWGAAVAVYANTGTLDSSVVSCWRETR